MVKPRVIPWQASAFTISEEEEKRFAMGWLPPLDLVSRSIHGSDHSLPDPLRSRSIPCMFVGTILSEEVSRKQVCLFVIINFVRSWCARGILVMMPVTCGHPLDWKFSIVLRMWRRNEPE